MLRQAALVSCFVLLASVAPRRAFTVLVNDGASSPGDTWWPLEHEAHPGHGLARPGRSLQETVSTVKGLPVHFSIRPMVDNSLCVHMVHLASDKAGAVLTAKEQAAVAQSASAVAAARKRSGLPETEEEDVEEYGTTRLVLLSCAGSSTDTFTAESLLGRFYFNNGTNYRQGFLKPSADNGVCVYGVNASYTVGHAVFGVTGSEYYTAHPDSAKGAAVQPLYERDGEDAAEMDWFDEYNFDYAPYLRYGYDPVTMTPTTGFKPENPLPVTMLDASGWGPFHAAWGSCMRNPTLDTAVPTEDPSTELSLRYHSWVFVNVAETASISHLPRAASRIGYALLTLGPDRPQPDVSAMAGEMDAGDLSAMLGGSDKPYGTGYSTLVSNELCMTAGSIREGAQVRLSQCNPVAPSLEQVFQLVPSKKPRPPAAKQAKAAAKKKKKAAAAAAAAAAQR